MKTTIYLILISILVFSCKNSENSLELVGWGDSMMKGAGGERSILEVISEELGGVEYTNYGVGGLKSNSIAVLQGGLPLKIVLENNEIKKDEVSNIIYYNIDPFNFQTKPFRSGHILGIQGKIERLFEKEEKKKTLGYNFSADDIDKTIQVADTTVFEFDDAVIKKNAITIIWSGRNDRKSGGKNRLYKIRDNIQAMIDHLDARSKERLLILSVCNGIGDKEFKGSNAHTNVRGLNEVLKDSFKEYFVDVRTYMINKAIYDLGLEPTAQDLEDIKKDCIPRSLLKDNVHFNTLGYEATGKYLAEIIRKKGWID